uniref:Uncharacterized protein n=1 Tax=Anguilla anguilla TaxID=7936 RepID=A0A0E9VZW7_ANGAN
MLAHSVNGGFAVAVGNSDGSVRVFPSCLLRQSKIYFTKYFFQVKYRNVILFTILRKQTKMYEVPFNHC